jgi:HEPN domain-containing protein
MLNRPARLPDQPDKRLPLYGIPLFGSSIERDWRAQSGGQAAEKYLKSYLVWRDIEFPRTHALEDLVLLAGATEPDFLPLKDEASVLTPYAVEARYPEFEVPSLKDAEEAVSIAEKIQAFVLQKLPEEVKSGNR